MEQRLRTFIYLNTYTFHISLYDLVLLGTLFIGIDFSLLLWFTRKIKPGREFSRMKHLSLCFGLVWLLWIPLKTAEYFYGRNHFGVHSYDPLILFLVVAMILLLTKSLIKPKVIPEETPVPKPQIPVELRQMGTWLQQTMEAGTYYRDAELSLSSLADALDIPARDLSRIINTALRKNFHDFVNEYRVRELMRKIPDPAYDRFTLLGMALDAGFNSKSTFNRTFRQMTGKSPAEYKSSLKKERPTRVLRPYSPVAAVVSYHEVPPTWSPVKLNRNYMFRNYLKVAWRNLLRNKTHTFINVSGLSVGMAVAMLIGLWIYDELAADKHFKNYGSIYQVIMHQSNEGVIFTNWVTPFPMGDELKSKYSDLKAVAMCDGGGRHSLVNGDKKVMKDGYFIGEDAVNMFSLNILYGDRNPLHDPNSIILTDETARILFNTSNAVGKIVKLDNVHNLKVTAIVAKQPKNSSLIFDCLLPWKLQESIYPDTKNYISDWGNNSWRTFVQLNDNANMESVNAKIKDVVLNHFADNKIMQASKPQIELFPMSKWRLYTDFENGKNVGGYIKYVRLFGILGMIILLIACINFMNLSTARSSKRAKEIGIRKAIGSLRKQLIAQFLSESLLITLIAFFLALIIVFFALPYFNGLTQKDMSLFIPNPAFWSFIVVFTLLTGLIAGSYPALYLSSFNPVKVLKGNANTGSGSALPRKILVVVQFASAIVLMVGTIIIYRQIQHGKDRPVGYEKNGLLSVNYSSEMSKSFNPLQNDLLASGMVYSACKSNSPATENQSAQNGWEWKGSKPGDKNMGINTIATEYNFTKTLGIRLVAGRDFAADYATDSAAVLLNQAAVNRMQLKNPVGETIKWNGQNRTVIGVVPNLQMESPFQSVSPMIIKFSKDWVNCLIVRINPKVSMSKALGTIKPIFEKYNGQFEYQFADEAYAKKFNYEELVANLAASITVIGIFISCLGIFGLASYMAEQRTKEIGVRKVLGASVTSLWRLLSKDFVLLVVISLVIAMPVAYYLMHNWLQNYTYRAELSWWIFTATAAGAILITLITVSYQAIRAALINPVKSLKSE